MDSYEFYTLEVKSSSSEDFVPCRLDNNQIEKFDSFESAVSSCFLYTGHNIDCVIRVVKHIHASVVMCEISKFVEQPKFEFYG